MAVGNPTPTLDAIALKARSFLATLFSLPAMLSILLVAALYYIYSQSQLSANGTASIANIDYARGLITLLFSVGTIAIALILTFAAVFQDTTALANSTDAKERFERGREVLGTLIGIFGTIVGFYFGSASPSGTTAKPAVAVIQPVITAIDPKKVNPNVETKLVVKGTGFASGSVILFENQTLQLLPGTTSTQIEFSLPKESATVGDKQVRVLDPVGDHFSNKVTITVGP